jgi:hypothetical protein
MQSSLTRVALMIKDAIDRENGPMADYPVSQGKFAASYLTSRMAIRLPSSSPFKPNWLVGLMGVYLRGSDANRREIHDQFRSVQRRVRVRSRLVAWNAGKRAWSEPGSRLSELIAGIRHWF